MGRLIARRPVCGLRPAGSRQRPDSIAVEEPLELRVDGKPLAVTMRTPGHDVELAHGFLHTEGVIGSADDIRDARYCDSRDDEGRNTYNVLDLGLAPGVPRPTTGVERNFYTTSSCGVCGKASPRRGTHQDPPLPATTGRRHHQVRRTRRLSPTPCAPGSRSSTVPAACTPPACSPPTGELLVVREDVGRHNAVDKVVGWALLNGRIPARGLILIVSGRTSFELAQKAVMAGIPILGAVSAPSPRSPSTSPSSPA